MTWSKKVPGIGTALAANPGSFALQYAGLRTIYGSNDGSANGVYRSFDAGDTWQRLDGPWGAVTNSGHPILLALPPSNTNMIYVCFSGESLWQSTNAWAPTPAWTQVPLPPGTPTFAVMLADHTDSSVLYAGDFHLWRLSGGAWSDITGSTHVDQHALAWAGSKLLLGNDGGLWSSDDRGDSWSNHNAGLDTIQFYRGSLHPDNANFALGGSQDNGEEKWLGGTTWQFFFGGDDFSSAIANTQPDQDWAISYYYLAIQRTRNGGMNWDAADGGIESGNRPFFSLFVKSPANDDVFITPTHRMWKTTNFFSGASVLWFTNGPDMGNAITAMAFAPSDASGQTYACGAGNSNYWAPNAELELTTDGGATWTDLDPAGQIPNRTVTGLAFASSNANVLYVTLSGFNGSGKPGHVFKTLNALSANPTWTDISPPVDLPFNAIVANGPGGEDVYAGSDMGVWHSGDGGTNWVHTGPEAGMPNVVVNDLQLNPATGRLAAFTYGRGAFVLTTTSTRIIALSGNLAYGNVPVGTTAQAVLTVANAGTSDLTVTNISYPDGFSGSWSSGAIASGESQNVIVTFAPSVATTYSGKIMVTSDATGGTNSIAVSATAVPAGTSGLPSPWLDADVGNVGASGSAAFAGGTFTVRGSGADIWGTGDAFHFVHQPLDGDGVIIARVTGLQYTDPWAKAGVMIRQSLDAGSPQAMMVVTPGSGAAFQYRTNFNDYSYNIGGSAGATAPYWAKLARTGTTITAYQSADGSSWAEVGSATISMTPQVYAGLALTAHNYGAVNTATFDNVQVLQTGVSNTVAVAASPAGGGTVSGGGSFVSGSSVTVTATANAGFEFMNWTEGGTEVSTDSS